MRVDPKKDRAHYDSDQQRASLAARVEKYVATLPT